MEEKCTYIDEIVVQTPHDAVSEFIERLRASQAVGEEDTPNNDAIEPPTLQLTTRYASPKTEKEIAEARENSVPLKNFPSHSALPNINIKDCTQITFNFHY